MSDKMREAFETAYNVPVDAEYNERLDSYRYKKYPGVNHPVHDLYDAFREGSEWHAAQRQGMEHAELDEPMTEDFKAAWINGLPLDSMEAKWAFVGWREAQRQGGNGHASDPRAAEILGKAIHEAGAELGVVREESELSGPQLLMVLDDIKHLAKRQGGEAVGVIAGVDEVNGTFTAYYSSKPPEIGRHVYTAPQPDVPEPDWTPCTWEQMDECTWHSGCGQTWHFPDSDDMSPSGNGMKYCHNCGSPIQERPEPPEDA